MNKLTNKKILNVVMVFSFLPLIIYNSIPATAGEQRFYYDQNGNPAGNSITTGNQTFYYDKNGSSAGNSIRYGNQTFYYDQNGNSAGNSLNYDEQWSSIPSTNPPSLFSGRL